MPTKDPVELTETAWELIATGTACSVQCLEGRAWVRHAAAPPPVSPPAAFINDREYDGHLIGEVKADHSYVIYSGSENTYARAVTVDGAVVIATES